MLLLRCYSLLCLRIYISWKCKTIGQSNLTKARVAAAHKSFVFARWHQCSPPIYSVYQKKLPTFLFFQYICERLTDFNDFWSWNPEKICDLKVLYLPTSPLICSHFTLGNPKKSFFSNIVHTHFWLKTLSQNKTNCNRDCELAHDTWKLSLHYLVKCITC